MGILGFVKDLVLLPINIVLDLTFIAPMIRSVTNDNDADSPFSTLDRIRSMVGNLASSREDIRP
jgi:hypothetical protein